MSSLFALDRRAILRSYALPFLIVYAALALLAMGLATLLARGVVRPVTAVSQAARPRGRRRPDTCAWTSTRPGEVGDLRAAFNEMVGDLDAQRRELARLEKLAAWRTMARMLAHEIKNPLTPILLAVQEPRRQLPGRRRAAPGHARRVRDHRRARRWSGCATSCASSPSSRGCRSRSRATADLRALARRAGAPVRGPARVAAPADAAAAAIDPAELRRALINLIDNGLAACRRGRARRSSVALGVSRGRRDVRG